MQQFGESPEVAHLIFVLEMRTFNFRFEKHFDFHFREHLIFHLIFTELSSPSDRSWPLGRPQAASCASDRSSPPGRPQPTE